MMARMVQTHIRTTLRTVVFDGVPSPRHAHVSNAMCDCNVYSLSLAAGNGMCKHGKSHEIVVTTDAIGYRESTMNIKYNIQLEKRKVPTNKAEGAWKLQTQISSTVVRKNSS